MPAVYVVSVPIRELHTDCPIAPGGGVLLFRGREFATFSATNSFTKPTMELTKSFPPADAFVEMITEIDYKKHFNTFMDGVENLCLIVAAIVTVIAQKWQEHNMTERTQLFVLRVIEGAKTFYAWVKNVFVPECQEFYNDCRSFYNYVRTI